MKTRSLPVLLLASSMLAFAAGQAVIAADMPAELTDALAGKFKGTKVTAFGAFAGADEVKFNENVKAFEEKTGIDIQYESSKQFEATISTRVDAGNVPDLVDFPQPGLMGNFARTGKLVDLASFMSADYLKGQYIQSWLDMATKPGKDGKPIMAGVWERVNVKSLVWYPKKAFDAAGYKVPATWDELKALQDQIVADGDTPWCIGIELGAATGWPATDWLEEMMLRTTSPENYDKWTTGQLKFASPEVKHAADMIAGIWTDDKYVYGGRKAIVSTSFGDAPAPMFASPPKCWLHKQGNFIVSFFPQDRNLKPDVDYAFFYLPGIDPQYGKPALVGGDIWSMFSDRPETRAVMEWFTPRRPPEDLARLGRHHRAPQGCRCRLVRQRDRPRRCQDPGQCDQRPFRRLRPHAGRSRRRLVLEGDDRLGQRLRGSRYGVEEHRRFLAAEVGPARHRRG